MTETTNQKSPVAAVASLHARFRIGIDPMRRGPVPLSRLLDEHNLLYLTLPRLTRASIAEHLLTEDIAPGNLLDSGDPDELFAGFIFRTETVGFVFVGELEPVGSQNGGPQKVKVTPLGRWRYTAAHELAHFLLHRDRMHAGQWIGDTTETIREAEGAETIEMEREANQFAAELLMPASVCRPRAEEFKAAYRACPLSAFAYHLASELLVSPEAMRYRLRGLGVGDE